MVHHSPHLPAEISKFIQRAEVHGHRFVRVAYSLLESSPHVLQPGSAGRYPPSRCPTLSAYATLGCSIIPIIAQAALERDGIVMLPYARHRPSEAHDPSACSGRVIGSCSFTASNPSQQIRARACACRRLYNSGEFLWHDSLCVDNR